MATKLNKKKMKNCEGSRRSPDKKYKIILKHYHELVPDLERKRELVRREAGSRAPETAKSKRQDRACGAYGRDHEFDRNVGDNTSESLCEGMVEGIRSLLLHDWSLTVKCVDLRN